MNETVTIDTARGAVAGRFDEAPGAVAAVLLVGGADGGFDGPAEALYPTLAADLVACGVSALRLDFRLHRFPNDVEEGVRDALAGLHWLEQRGYARVALVGHSFGGAVVIEAGVRAANVAGVATLATQTAGAERVAELAPRPLLLIHGAADIRLPPACSVMLHRMAGEPRELVLIEGATHSLRQAREQVRARLLEWVCAVLAPR
ncbi:MAG: alpha/beta hydrolase [Dehalococcoidia bacterium]|nr:alpha/beta hydrolase [Dehalococcoidia bacterium]